MIELRAGPDPDLSAGAVDREEARIGAGERIGQRPGVGIVCRDRLADRRLGRRVLGDLAIRAEGRELGGLVRARRRLRPVIRGLLQAVARAMPVAVVDRHPQVVIQVGVGGRVTARRLPADNAPTAAVPRALPGPRRAEHAIRIAEGRREHGLGLGLLRGEGERARLLNVPNGHGHVVPVVVGPIRGAYRDAVLVVPARVRGVLEIGRRDEAQHAVAEREGAAVDARERLPDDRASLGVRGAVAGDHPPAVLGEVDAVRARDLRRLVHVGDRDGHSERARLAAGAGIDVHEVYVVTVGVLWRVEVGGRREGEVAAAGVEVEVAGVAPRQRRPRDRVAFGVAGSEAADVVGAVLFDRGVGARRLPQGPHRHR